MRLQLCNTLTQFISVLWLAASPKMPSDERAGRAWACSEGVVMVAHCTSSRQLTVISWATHITPCNTLSSHAPKIPRAPSKQNSRQAAREAFQGLCVLWSGNGNLSEFPRGSGRERFHIKEEGKQRHINKKLSFPSRLSAINCPLIVPCCPPAWACFSEWSWLYCLWEAVLLKSLVLSLGTTESCDGAQQLYFYPDPNFGMDSQKYLLMVI